MGRDTLKRRWPITPFFCEDDFNAPIDEWTEEDEKKLKKRLDKSTKMVYNACIKSRKD